MAAPDCLALFLLRPTERVPKAASRIRTSGPDHSLFVPTDCPPLSAGNSGSTSSYTAGSPIALGSRRRRNVGPEQFPVHLRTGAGVQVEQLSMHTTRGAQPDVCHAQLCSAAVIIARVAASAPAGHLAHPRGQRHTTLIRSSASSHDTTTCCSFSVFSGGSLAVVCLHREPSSTCFAMHLVDSAVAAVLKLLSMCPAKMGIFQRVQHIKGKKYLDLFYVLQRVLTTQESSDFMLRRRSHLLSISGGSAPVKVRLTTRGGGRAPSDVGADFNSQLWQDHRDEGGIVVWCDKQFRLKSDRFSGTTVSADDLAESRASLVAAFLQEATMSIQDANGEDNPTGSGTADPASTNRTLQQGADDHEGVGSNVDDGVAVSPSISSSFTADPRDEWVADFGGMDSSFQSADPMPQEKSEPQPGPSTLPVKVRRVAGDVISRRSRAATDATVSRTSIAGTKKSRQVAGPSGSSVSGRFIESPSAAARRASMAHHEPSATTAASNILHSDVLVMCLLTEECVVELDGAAVKSVWVRGKLEMRAKALLPHDGTPRAAFFLRITPPGRFQSFRSDRHYLRPMSGGKYDEPSRARMFQCLLPAHAERKKAVHVLQYARPKTNGFRAPLVQHVKIARSIRVDEHDSCLRIAVRFKVTVNPRLPAPLENAVFRAHFPHIAGDAQMQTKPKASWNPNQHTITWRVAKLGEGMKLRLNVLFSLRTYDSMTRERVQGQPRVILSYSAPSSSKQAPQIQVRPVKPGSQIRTIIKQRLGFTYRMKRVEAPKQSTV